jgi:hypothetical protein
MNTQTPKEIYSRLRQFALTQKANSFSDSLAGKTVFGVVMDWNVGEGVASVVAFVDGSASLYFSSGGGVIGGKDHDAVRRAAMSLCAEAEKHQTNTMPSVMFPLPPSDQSTIWLLTTNGARNSTAPANDFGNNRHSLSPVFHKAQDLIAAIRNMSEKK